MRYKYCNGWWMVDGGWEDVMCDEEEKKRKRLGLGSLYFQKKKKKRGEDCCPTLIFFDLERRHKRKKTLGRRNDALLPIGQGEGTFEYHAMNTRVPAGWASQGGAIEMGTVLTDLSGATFYFVQVSCGQPRLNSLRSTFLDCFFMTFYDLVSKCRHFLHPSLFGS